MKSSELKPTSIHNILLGVTGSVAAIKAPELVVKLLGLGANVTVLLSRGATNFWTKAQSYNPRAWAEMEHLLNEGSLSVDSIAQLKIIGAEDEWAEWNELGDAVTHIDLRDWADLMVIAPLSAHTLAKLANGLCDDTLSCVARAWDYGHGPREGKPFLVAPAMNTAMWDHPVTKQHLETIQGFWNYSRCSEAGVIVVEPQQKMLACGEIGNGALAPVDDIIAAVLKGISSSC